MRSRKRPRCSRSPSAKWTLATSSMSRSSRLGRLDDAEPRVRRGQHRDPGREVLRRRPSATSASRRCSNNASSRPRSTSGSAAVSLAMPGEKKSMRSAMSTGGRRFETSQRVARSTSVRVSSRIAVWTSASITLSSSALRASRSGCPKIRDAARLARTTSSIEPPVSSESRWYAVMPDELMNSLTTWVVMISRRSWCDFIGSANRSWIAFGKYDASLDCQVVVVRQRRLEQLRFEHDLGVRDQHRQLRRGQPTPVRLAPLELRDARQELQLPVQQALTSPAAGPSPGGRASAPPPARSRWPARCSAGSST